MSADDRPVQADRAAAQPFRLGFRPALEGLRGVGILLVIEFHTVTFLDPKRYNLMRGGFIGVDIFFVLSGFLITSLLLEEFRRSSTISIPGFYFRRVLRLFPAVAALLIASTVYVLATGLSLTAQARTVVAMLTYSANWLLRANLELTQGFGHIWSLAIEEQFYLVWPTVLFLLLRRVRSTRVLVGSLGAVVVAGAVWRAVLMAHDRIWSLVYYRTDVRIDQLIAGALLAVLMHHGWVRVRSRPVVAVVAAAALVPVALRVDTFHDAYYYWGATLVTVATVFLIASTLEGTGPVAAVLCSRPLRFFGRISYSLYLWHVPVYAAFLRYAATRPFYLRVGGAEIISLALAMASYHYVEQPFLRLKDRISERRKAAAAAAANPA